MTRTRHSIFVLVGLVALLAAACSSTGGGASASVPAASVPAASEPAASPAGGGAVALDVADSTAGRIVVDGAGMTLYGFTPDEGGTPTCYDACAGNWPPLLADDPAAVTAAADLDKTKLTTADRTDGGKQLLYNGWPLYYFANDAAAGDINGQGQGDKWYVLSPAGDLIKD